MRALAEPIKLLPRAAARLLQEASQTPIPGHYPLARVEAIEKATERVKTDHPEFFQERN